ncbi:MAG TPA: FAD:protein FMN transferase [Longimicrobiales bacterium]
MTLLTLAGPESAPARAAEPCPSGSARLERTAFVMGALLRIEVEGVERACGVAVVEAALREVERLESVLSSWRTDSEVGVLNAWPAGAAAALSAELAALLAEAGGWVAATGGAFDPAIGALIDAWDLRGSGRVPSEAELERARAASGWRHVRLERGRATRLAGGVWLDTGGFGKGAALRAAAAVLRAAGVERAVLDFSGQLVVLGTVDSVAVAHPRARDVPAARLRVADASVATTSASERFVEISGVRYGHVLDPRTGMPVRAWGSVTVVAADPVTADALSTALFVLGPDAALAWAAGRADVGVLVLRAGNDGAAVPAWNATMARHLRAVPDPASSSFEDHSIVTRFR